MGNIPSQSNIGTLYVPSIPSVTQQQIVSPPTPNVFGIYTDVLPSVKPWTSVNVPISSGGSTVNQQNGISSGVSSGSQQNGISSVNTGYQQNGISSGISTGSQQPPLAPQNNFSLQTLLDSVGQYRQNIRYGYTSELVKSSDGSNTITGDNNKIIGTSNIGTGSTNTLIGINNRFIGNSNNIYGVNNVAAGNNNTIFKSQNNTLIGNSNTVL